LGNLVRLSRKDPGAKVDRVALGPAQILLFTGVRYERDGRPQPDKPKASAGPQRKNG